MTITTLIRIQIRELREKIKKNGEYDVASHEKARLAQINQFVYKLEFSMVVSSLPYLLLIPAFSFMPAIAPGWVLPLIASVGSFGIGVIGSKLIYWKSKSKEKFKSFTTAKTQSEIVQEEMKYTIESEKAQNRNRAIRVAITALDGKTKIKYPSQTIDESKKRIDELSTQLNEKYNELDVLSTQKVLHEKSWEVRTKKYSLMDIIMSSLLIGLFPMLYIFLPFITILEEVIINPPLIFATYAAGITGVGGYMIKRNKDYMKAFNNLNNDLKENALPEEIEDPTEEKRDIDAKIQSLIEEIFINEVRLQEEKVIMKSFVDNGKEKENKLEISNSKEYTIEEPRKDTTFEYNNIFNDTEIDSQEKEGPSLVLRRKPNNTQNSQK